MKSKLYIVSCLLATLTTASFVRLVGSSALAETTSINATVNVASSCTFSGAVSPSHSATIPSGTYTSNIGITTMNIICNDSEGFSIYAIGYSNNENGNNKLLATVGGSLSPTNDISTGTNTSGAPSSWAMKLTAISGDTTPTILNNYDNYSAVPSTNTKVATLSSSTGSTSGANIETTYAANIAGNQPAGEYNGKVKYTFVHPASEVPIGPRDATQGCISYWPNASGVADSMADDCNSGPSGSGYGNNATANLWASNFKRDGYGFAGWSTTYDYSDSAGLYGPNETITTPSDMTTKGLSLYAIWIPSAGNLQSWNGCSAMSIGDTTALTDTRDNNTYAIAKLADNNCWMIENLRLDNTAELTTTNTNNPLITFGTVAIKNDDGSTTNHLSPTSSYWCIDYDSACFDQSKLNTDNTANPDTNMTAYNNNTNTYSLGNYYNWYSATAGNGTSSEVSGNTAGDICPAGWHLPTGNSSGEFYALNTAINSGATNTSLGLRKYPANFIYSGFVNSWVVVNRSTGGYYWSSTASRSYYAYGLSFFSSAARPGTDDLNKYVGFMARCLYGS